MPQQINIRQAERNDADKVYEFICDLENEILEHESFVEIFGENIHDDNYVYLVALIDNEVTGFISCHTQYLLHHAGRVAEIQEFYVTPVHRRSGIGRFLIHEAEQFVIQKGAKLIEVTFNQRRILNTGIYERYGYATTHHKMTRQLG